ncbi:hypothetical protein [Halopseudomonas salegens]|uniref:Uncharacterized protein n=1 Tax=Halopseudomonas salegens TaxID=1434072 RepID=A0A1H2E4I8_9GAMM|nr:hypothetical protein [Halopseudomonas salegens]SDT90031.1 hypothetical protein SAMN05216210_0328 [Halopseudomonas salegens]
MAVRLEFLTQDPEEIELAKRYWAMDGEGAYIEKVSDLVPFRKLTQSSFVSSHVRQWCLAYDENQRCYLCSGAVSVTKRHEPRKAFQLSSRPCAACTESIKQDELRMRQAEEAELQCMLEKRSHEMYSRTISYESLPDDVCVLLVAIDMLLGPRLAKGTFKEAECDALAPYGSSCFFRRLREEHIILDSPRMARPGTYFLEDDELMIRRNQAEYFLVADEKCGRGDKAIRTIAEREFTDAKALFELWLDYAENDVVRYLFDQCDTYRLILEPEDLEKIRGAVRQGLHTYSVSQLWFVVWVVIKGAASYANHRFSNRTKAAATIPRKIRKQLEMAAQENGIGRSWNRPDGHLAGSLGKVFLNTFQIDEKADGRQVFQRFTLLNPSNMELESLESAAASFMRRALERQNSGTAMVNFAEAIRAGCDAWTALERGMFTDQR